MPDANKGDATSCPVGKPDYANSVPTQNAENRTAHMHFFIVILEFLIRNQQRRSCRGLVLAWPFSTWRLETIPVWKGRCFRGTVPRAAVSWIPWANSNEQMRDDDTFERTTIA